MSVINVLVIKIQQPYQHAEIGNGGVVITRIYKFEKNNNTKTGKIGDDA